MNECQFGKPIDFSDIIPKYYDKLQEVAKEQNEEETKKVQYQLYKEVTDRVESV